MGKYTSNFVNFTTATTSKTGVSVDADGAGELGEIVECMMTGSGSVAAADRQHRASLDPCTFATAGTGTAQTPQPFKQITQAALLASSTAYSAEPSVIANTSGMVVFGFNQRGGMRWAVPQGEGVWCSNATEESGMAWRVISDAAGATDGYLHWWE